MMKKAYLLSFVCLILCSQIVLAQVTTATIRGTIRDETGAVVPGISVIVRATETGTTRMAEADAQGRYVAPNLQVGNYEVRAELAGFQAAVRTGIRLTLGQMAVVDLTLTVGAVTESVVVTGEAPLVETTQSSVSQLVDERKIEDLPLSVRSYAELATLQVGVLNTVDVGTNNAGTGYGQQLSFAGSRPDANVYLLDGSDINNAYNKAPNSGTGGVIGVEAVREFEVKTSTYSAEYGRSMGGVLNSITKSGTNSFHGSAYEFIRNDNLDARNFFDRDPENPLVRSNPPPFARNQFGVSVGGPIQRDKTFFFGNYEGFRERLGLTNRKNVPDVQARKGIIPGEDSIDVVSAVQPYLANLDLFPLPTPGAENFGDGSAEYIFQQSQPTGENFALFRVDQNFSENDTLFVRYSFNDGDRRFSGHPFRRGLLARNQFTTLEETHIFSPRVLNSFRFSFNRNRNGQPEPTIVDIPKELWFNDQALGFGDLEPFGAISISGCCSASSYNFNPKDMILNIFELADDVSYIAGGHSLSIGTIFKRVRFNIQSGLYLRGSYTFRSLEDFLVGKVREFRAQRPGSDGIRGLRQNLFGLYVQDNYAVHPNLTLNLGLRYELVTVPTEVNGKMANLHDLLDAETTVGPPWKNPSLKNFAPRVGLAWSPFGDQKTSIRGGYGLFYDQIFYNYYHFVLSRTPPFMETAFIRNARFPDAFQDVVAGTFGVRNSLHAFDATGLKQPFMQQWNLNIQREILPGTGLTIGYLGSRGTNLGRLVDNSAFSAVDADGRRFIPEEFRGKRRNPNFAEIRQRTTDASSFYHALVVGANRRFSSGFSAQVSYTFSKSIDDSSVLQGAADTGGQGNQWSLLPEVPSFDRGLSIFHRKHNFVFNTSLELPFGPGKALGTNLTGFAGKLLGGWSLSNIVKLASGGPFNAELNFSRPLDGRTGGRGHRPDLVSGRSNNPVLGGPDQYYDPTAFAIPEEGFFGNVSRNTLIRPGLANWDFSLTKNTPVESISESFNIQFRAEFFNALNRANFGQPDRTVFTRTSLRTGEPNPRAGRITSTTNASRQVQFGLKLRW